MRRPHLFEFIDLGWWPMSRIVWHNLIPLVPLSMAWDVAASMIRSYTEEELAEMTRVIERDGYRWRLGRSKTIVYLLGYPDRR